jgi:ABC-type sugar transport system permease subunit
VNSKPFLTIQNKRTIFALCLLLPFMLGFIFMFFIPFCQSVYYTFHNITITDSGTVFTSVGWSNYKRLLFTDVTFRQDLVQSISNMLITIPMGIVYSLFMAVLLNKPFKGRSIAKIIFFLPVVITSGIILALEMNDLILQTTQVAVAASTTESITVYAPGAFDIKSLLYNMNLSTNIINYMISVVDKMYQIIISSGVQMILLLAAIQSIPKSLYEAAAMEGSNEWENFWKITFPMISPYIILCAVYSIVDNFTSPMNTVMQYIMDIAYQKLDYGFAAAMAWIYFLIIGIMLAVTVGLFAISRKASNYERGDAVDKRSKKRSNN